GRARGGRTRRWISRCARWATPCCGSRRRNCAMATPCGGSAEVSAFESGHAEGGEGQGDQREDDRGEAGSGAEDRAVGEWARVDQGLREVGHRAELAEREAEREGAPGRGDG